MKGYLYKETWNNEKEWWSGEKLFSPTLIDTSELEEIIENIHPEFGKYEICDMKKANTQFIIRDKQGVFLKFIHCKEQLPWD